MRTLRNVVFSVMLLSIAVAGTAAEPPTVVGHWITSTGNYEVDVAPCGEALCGTIIRVLGNRSMRDPNVEMQSPDPRPALGMRILSDLVRAGDGRWVGSIYDRESAKTYSCVVTLLDTGELSVRGYVVLPMFGRTALWHRP